LLLLQNKNKIDHVISSLEHVYLATILKLGILIVNKSSVSEKIKDIKDVIRSRNS